MDYPISYLIPTYNWISVDTPSGSRGTILVVDDDVQVRALTARALADDGFDVVQAPDAITAIGLLEDPVGAHVGLVITDIVMPGMRGDEFGRLLHHRRPMLPVLYMSGHSRPDLDFLPVSDLEHCWLQKPFSLPLLLERARALCVPARTLS
jgi:DNA-binding NtrC family response regulator